MEFLVGFLLRRTRVASSIPALEKNEVRKWPSMRLESISRAYEYAYYKRGWTDGRSDRETDGGRYRGKDGQTDRQAVLRLQCKWLPHRLMHTTRHRIVKVVKVFGHRGPTMWVAIFS